jgi:outer membrane protein assembly factor BamB
MSTDGSTVFAPVVNIPISYSKEETVTAEGPPFGGEVVALAAATGAVKWKQVLTAPAFGATTAVNNVVFATDFTGTLYAFEAASGKILWQTQLPARINTGVQVSGNMVIAPAGVAAAPGQTAKMVAYRLG